MQNHKNNTAQAEYDDVNIPDWDDLNRDFKELSIAEVPQKSINEIAKLMQEIAKSSRAAEEFAEAAVTFLKAAEKDVDYVNERRGLFSRIWGGITGNTENASLKTSQDLINAQKATLLLLVEMGKVNAFQQTQILALTNMLRYSIIEENGFRGELKEALNKLFKAIQNRFTLIERVINDVVQDVVKNRGYVIQHAEAIRLIERRLAKHDIHLDKIENKLSFLMDYVIRIHNELITISWVTRLESYDTPYLNPKLSDIDKFFMLVFDFYKVKRGVYTYNDLMLFSTGLRRLNFDMFSPITVKEFLIKFDAYCKDESKRMEFETKLEFTADARVLNNFQNSPYGQTQYIRSLNLLAFAYTNRNSFGDDINAKMIDNLGKAGISGDAVLNWLLIAAEIFSHLEKVDQKRKDSVIHNDWQPLIIGLRDKLSITNYVELIKSNVLVPTLRQFGLYYNSEVLFDNNLIGFSEFIKRIDLSSLSFNDGKIELATPFYTSNEPVIFKITTRNNGNTLIIISELEFLKDKRYENEIRALEGLSEADGSSIKMVEHDQTVSFSLKTEVVCIDDEASAVELGQLSNNVFNQIVTLVKPFIKTP